MVQVDSSSPTLMRLCRRPFSSGSAPRTPTFTVSTFMSTTTSRDLMAAGTWNVTVTSFVVCTHVYRSVLPP